MVRLIDGAVSADACVKEACTPEELKIAQAMLWDHLEGNDCPGMRQQRPVGWKQGAPETWVEGHGDGAMTSTTHCDAMWYIRTRPGVVGGFRAAYQEHGVVAVHFLFHGLAQGFAHGHGLHLRAFGLQERWSKLSHSRRFSRLLTKR